MSRHGVGTSLCLSLLSLMSAAAVSAATLYVHCGTNSGLNSIGAALNALKNSEENEPSTINVTGICRENIRIQGLDRLTLNGVNGAQIIDASNNSADTIIVTQSQSVVIQGFTVQGGVDAFDVYGNATARLTNITVSGALYDGVAAYHNATVIITNANLHNNGFAGVLSSASDVVVSGLTSEFNYEGIYVNNGGRVGVSISDPFYDGTATSLPTRIANNQDLGVLVQRGHLSCNSCIISGNATGGLFADMGATVILGAYSSATLPSAPATTVTGNVGTGVVVGPLSNVTFPTAPPNNVSGNGGILQIVCNTGTSVTRRAVLAAGAGNTNCVDR
jgi:hypothetical protein